MFSRSYFPSQTSINSYFLYKWRSFYICRLSERSASSHSCFNKGIVYNRYA